MFSAKAVLVASSGLCMIALALPASAQIPKADNTPYAAPKDKALVVFTRPRHRQASETEFRIVTHAGRCLAMLVEIDGTEMVMVFLDSYGKLTPFGDANRTRKWLQTGVRKNSDLLAQADPGDGSPTRLD